MNNNAFGMIAGLQKGNYGLTYSTTFPKDGDDTLPNYADVARAYGVDGVCVRIGGRVQASPRGRDRLRQADRHRRRHG